MLHFTEPIKAAWDRHDHIISCFGYPSVSTYWSNVCIIILIANARSSLGNAGKSRFQFHELICNSFVWIYQNESVVTAYLLLSFFPLRLVITMNNWKIHIPIFAAYSINQLIMLMELRNRGIPESGCASVINIIVMFNWEDCMLTRDSSPDVGFFVVEANAAVFSHGNMK